MEVQPVLEGSGGIDKTQNDNAVEATLIAEEMDDLNLFHPQVSPENLF